MATCQQLQNQPSERWLLRKRWKWYNFNVPFHLSNFSTSAQNERGTDSTPAPWRPHACPEFSLLSHLSLPVRVPSILQGLAQTTATGGTTTACLPFVFLLAFGPAHLWSIYHMLHYCQTPNRLYSNLARNAKVSNSLTFSQYLLHDTHGVIITINGTKRQISKQI